MKVVQASLLLAGLLAGIPGSLASSVRGRRQAQDVESTVLCRLTIVDTLKGVIGDNIKFGSHSFEHAEEEYGCIPIQDNQETDEFYIVTVPDSIVETYRRNITKGTLLVRIDGATILNSELVVSDQAKFRVIEQVPSHMRHLLQTPSTIGTRTFYVVRVSSADTSPDKTLSEIQQGMIGMDRPTFQSQFHFCSFGKLQWKLAGGVDVNLGQPISNFHKSSELLQAASAAVKSTLQIDDLRQLADHVIFCQPPGTGGWIAVAGVNHWISNFQGGYCSSLSALSHEISHNLGLLHSGLGIDPYGDTTGYMGYSFSSESWPRKCFNAFKSWELGWYEDRHLAVDPEGTTGTIKLGTFVDYPKTKENEPVIVNIADQYYIMFNKAKDFNVETQHLQNLVTITEDSPSFSLSRAGLDVGDRFTLSNFRSGRSLVVEVCSKLDGDSTQADVMVLSISLDKSFCGDASAPPPSPVEEDCNVLNTPCSQHSDCCGPELRCLDRHGAVKCRYCRLFGQRCGDDSECCSGANACDVNAGICVA